jgi:hypothetical protein
MSLCVLLPDLQVVGSVHLAGKVDPVQATLDGTEPFLLLTEATLTLAQCPAAPLTTPLVLVNRAHFAMVSLVA